MTSDSYITAGGVEISRSIKIMPMGDALDEIMERLDTHCGGIFASDYEYPGRYSRWDVGYVDPPLEIIAQQRRFTLRALNERGRPLLRILYRGLEGHEHFEHLEIENDKINGIIKPMPDYFLEEERSKQPSIFSVLRALMQLMHSDQEAHLGFYGAMGYDLVFQFEPSQLHHKRAPEAPDLHLFLPDELIIIDHRKEQAYRYNYDFQLGQDTTVGCQGGSTTFPLPVGTRSAVTSDHQAGEYADKVRQIIAGTRRGDFFEVVLSQVLSTGFVGTPRALFERIRRTNPSPYEFLLNLGREQLVGASPEMFVRVEGDRVETCPISGTIRRGATPIEDAERILELLNSAKDEAELTMCTDVDRNDKARVCQAGTVEVIGRRLIEIYSRLIHTVDHVVGHLREGCDAFDALLSHMWACTLTGSPKPAAMQKIEELENSARQWYGGCVGMLFFNGDINTGITIRTVHLKEGQAHVRVGATLLCDSDPDDEERETRTKAEAFLNAIVEKDMNGGNSSSSPIAMTGVGKRVLFVDNRDSFVHTLGDYVRQTGADVVTVRAGFPERIIDEVKPDLIFISPGPGTPEELGVPDLIRRCVVRQLPIFGVCLGLQGMVEAFGGKLGVLEYPVHGKSSVVECISKGILEGFPNALIAGRYHSLYALPEALPACFEVLARTEDKVIMALQHRDYPAAAVQFHPESILTIKDDLGLRLIAQVIDQLA